MASRIKVRCAECGKKWLVSPGSSMVCARCNSSDVEVRQ